jgi:CheY-like chemotaxis protein
LKFVEIVVSDNGIGIPHDQIGMIFDRFYRADNVLRSSDGCGIGLSLVKELVELHHGNVKVTSLSGKGTSFILRLPAEREAYKKDELADAVFEDWHRHSMSVEPQIHENDDENYCSFISDDGEKKDLPSVLIMEDNKDVMRYIRKCISRRYRTLSAYNGEDGLQDALENVPDLVLTDVVMPGMDGFELCRRLKSDERTSHIPVVLLTARAAAGDKIAGLETGADDYIAKPFDPQ